MSDRPEWMVIGKITSAHGIRGEVKMQLFVDELGFLDTHRAVHIGSRLRRRVALERWRMHKGQAILSLEGIDDRNEAERLRGREVSVPYEWLPELDADEYYVAQIVGLEVESHEGERLGRVAEVLFTGANEVYVVRDGPHGEFLLPAIASVVERVDIEGGRLEVRLPEGLID